jgi:hypothetical protein
MPVEAGEIPASLKLVHSRTAFGLAFGVIAVILAACTQDAERPDLPSVIGNPNPAEVIGKDGVSRSSLQSCEDFGPLTGSSAAIRLIGTSLESASFNATDRPQTTRLTILASGDPKVLAGKAAPVGAGDNANFATCTHCVVVAIGCSGSDCSRAALFYPRSGSAMFASVATTGGETFEGSLENAELVQVTIDTQTQRSTPVAGGACIKVPTLSFRGTAVSAPAGEPPSGGGTSGTNATSSSSSTSSTSSSGHGGSSSGGLGNVTGSKTDLL